MKLWWLAQGGMCFETADGITVMIDPYLSDYMHEKRGEMFKRLIPIDKSFLSYSIDILIITHCHMDHMDMGTLPELLKNNPNLTILSPRSVWSELRPLIGVDQNSVMLNHKGEWTEKGVCIRAIYAQHSDEYAIGVQLLIDGWNIYLTGDTLYSRDILEDLKTEHGKVNAVFTCINGKGNNMNPQDAARLVNAIAPDLAVPLHWDLFNTYKEDPKHFIEFLTDSDICTCIMQQYAPYVLLRRENMVLLLPEEQE